jgi:2,3,4,5-tetrahydropyridine-2-carboxylate N-succinyltransferase
MKPCFNRRFPELSKKYFQVSNFLTVGTLTLAPMMELENKINQIWDLPAEANSDEGRKLISGVIECLEDGSLRVAEKEHDQWRVNEWIKKAILLYFRIQKNEKLEAGFFEFYDKMKVKTGFESKGVRAVPPAVARFGSYIAPGVILMPSYVNIGAYVDSGTMVDTWATVGSCAQIGKDVHLSGGVGIGGVLEPLQANPVIIEDGAFIGSRAIIVEGALVGAGAVIGAGVVLTGSTRIVDVSGPEPVTHKGYIPPRSVVIPGSVPKTFPAGTFQIPCALIIGKRSAGTDLKVSLNEALRDYQVSV